MTELVKQGHATDKRGHGAMTEPAQFPCSPLPASTVERLRQACHRSGQHEIARRLHVSQGYVARLLASDSCGYRKPITERLRRLIATVLGDDARSICTAAVIEGASCSGGGPR